jgi:IS4 transposase
MKSISKSHNIIRQKGALIFKQILPNEQLKKIAKKHHPNMRERALTIGVHLGLLIFAQLEKNIQGIEELIKSFFDSVKEDLGLPCGCKPITKQAFSKRNQTISWKTFRDIFFFLLDVYNNLVPKGERLYQGIYELKSMDTSLLDVVSRLIKVFKGVTGRGGKTRKAHAKMHVLYNNSTGVPELAFVTEGRTADIKRAIAILRKALEKGKDRGCLVLLIFDLGYLDFDFLNKVINSNAFFVTRIKENTVYEIIDQMGVGDYKIRLGVSLPSKQTQIMVRLIEIEEDGQTYRYITNLFDKAITPIQIREIYRRRWEIELFFRDIKHLFKTLKFFSYNENGIKIQIYSACITYVLCKILMRLTAQKYNVKEKDISFKRAVQATRHFISTNFRHLWLKRPRRKYMGKLLQDIYEFAYQPWERAYQQKRVAKLREQKIATA